MTTGDGRRYAVLPFGFSYCTTSAPQEQKRDESAKCDYCGRYGPLGQCEGCGAPNRPYQRIDITTFGDRKRRYLEVFSS